MVNNSININNPNNRLKSQNTKITTTYDAGNPGPGLGQAQKYGRIQLVIWIPTLPLLITYNCSFMSLFVTHRNVLSATNTSGAYSENLVKPFGRHFCVPSVCSSLNVSMYYVEPLILLSLYGNIVFPYQHNDFRRKAEEYMCLSDKAKLLEKALNFGLYFLQILVLKLSSKYTLSVDKSSIRLVTDS